MALAFSLNFAVRIIAMGKNFHKVLEVVVVIVNVAGRGILHFFSRSGLRSFLVLPVIGLGFLSRFFIVLRIVGQLGILDSTRPPLKVGGGKLDSGGPVLATFALLLVEGKSDPILLTDDRSKAILKALAPVFSPKVPLETFLIRVNIAGSITLVFSVRKSVHASALLFSCWAARKMLISIMEMVSAPKVLT